MAEGEITVRPMREADLEAVLDQVEEIAAEGRWLAMEAPGDREALRARIASGLGSPDSLALVAEVGGRLAGNLGVHPVRNGVAGLGMSDVFPHNEAAIALYRRVGFVEEGLLRRHYRRRDGELWDALLMALYL